MEERFDEEDFLASDRIVQLKKYKFVYSFARGKLRENTRGKKGFPCCVILWPNYSTR